MAITAEELQVKIVLDSEGAIKGFKDAKGNLLSFSKELENANDLTRTFDTGLGKLSIGLTGLNQGIELAKKAFSAIAAPIQQSIEKFKVQESAETSLANALRITGEFTEDNVKSFKNFASQLQENSTVGDEVSLTFLKIAKSMRLTDDQAMSLVQAATDLSAATGKNLESSFQQLLKTFGGFAGELGEAIPAVKNLTKEQLHSGKAIDLVKQQFEGFAKASTTTIAGSMQQAENAFSDLQEEIGKTVAELINLPQASARNKQFFNELIKTIKDLRPTLLGMRDDFLDFVAKLKAAFASIDLESLINKFEFFGLALTALASSAIASFLITLSKLLFDAITPVALLAAKFIAVSIAIIAVVGTIDILIRNLDRLDELSVVIGGAFLSAFERIKRGFQGVGLFILQGAEQIASTFAGSFLDVGGVGEAAISKIRAAQLSLADSIDQSNDKIHETEESLSQASQNIDFGFLGEMFFQGTKFAEAFNKEIGNVGDNLNKANDHAKNLNAAARSFGQSIDPEKLKQIETNLKAILEENKKLSLDILNIGVSDLDKLKNTLDYQLMQVEAKREELRLQGLLTGEIEAGLNKQKDLLQLKGGKEVEEVKKSKADQTATFSRDDVSLISDTLGQSAGDLASSISSFASPVTAFAAGANVFLDGIQGLIDLVPNLLSKIANIFTSLTDLPQRILAGLKNLTKAVGNFVAQYIPNLLKALPDELSEIFTKLPEAILDGFFQLLDALPEVINKLAERMPEVVQEFIHSFLTRAPRLITGIISFLIKDAPKIAFTIAKTIAVELPLAIIDGIIQAFLEIRDLLKGIFTGAIPNVTKKFQEGVKGLVEKGVGVANQLFQVLDIQEEARKLKAAEDFAQAVEDGSKRAGAFLAKLWQKLLDFFKQVGEFIVDLFKGAWELLKIIGGFLAELWKGVWGLLQFIGELLAELWRGVWGLLQVIGSGLADLWRATWALLESIGGSLADLWKATWAFLQTIGGALADLWLAAWGVLRDIGGVLAETWRGVWSFLKEIGGGLATLWQGVFQFFSDGAKSAANLLQGAFNFLSTAFSAIDSFFRNILGGLISSAWASIIDFFKSTFSTLVSSVWNPIKDFFKDIFKTNIQGAFDPIINFFSIAGKGFAKGISSAFDPILNFFGSIADKIKKPMQDVFDALNPANIIDKLFKAPGESKGFIEGKLGFDVPIVKFAEGGVVPGSPLVAGDSLLNDRILALLSPGEAIVPRSILSQPGMEELIQDIVSGKFVIPQYGFGVPKISAPKISLPSISDITEGAKNLGAVVSDTVKMGVSTIGEVGTAIASGDLNKLQDLILPSFDDLKDLIMDKVLSGISSLALQGFQEGGFVSGKGGPDSVGALLSPGEFVLSKPAVDQLGLGFLGALNRGNAATGQTTNIEVTVNIESRQEITSDFIRNRLVPTIKEELKRASLDGAFVISGRGIRS